MANIRLKDPNTHQNEKSVFQYQVGQRVCQIDGVGQPIKEKTGEVVNGIWTDPGNKGTYDEWYFVKMDDGGIARLRVSAITEQPSKN